MYEVLGVIFVAILGIGMIITGGSILSIAYGFGSQYRFDFVFGYSAIIIGLAIEAYIFTEKITIHIG